ncbi:MAG: ribonuclease D [Armatimonadetes bacterium]|nr:ribonuclease D [Armatimonadota bacterium]
MQRTFSPATATATTPENQSFPATDSLYVSDFASLEALAKRLEPALAADPRLAFDTEFIRERTYKPVLEIVQVATSDGFVAIVDVPALGGEWGILHSLFLDTGVEKILHAGGQDMEILTMVLGETPAPVFDTQVAAAFAGYSLQTGYGALVQAVLQVRLAKDEGFADWSRRPLTPAMREYAENDVRYLHALHDKLTELLARRGRTAWATEQMNRSLLAGTTELPPTELWRKVGGKNVLDRRGLAVLRELAAWRDAEAMRRDKPRRSVVKDDFLIEIARRAASDTASILGLRSAPQNLGEKNAQTIAEVVKRGVAIPSDDRPETESAQPLDEQGAVLQEMLNTVVRLRATEENLPPSLLASGDDLRTLAAERGSPDFDGALFRGWRGELVGEPLRALLEGRLSIGYDVKKRRVVLQTDK